MGKTRLVFDRGGLGALISVFVLMEQSPDRQAEEQTHAPRWASLSTMRQLSISSRERQRWRHQLRPIPPASERAITLPIVTTIV